MRTSASSSRLLILNYHDVYDKNALPLSRYAISKSTFVSHLNLLESLKIPVISISDFQNKDQLNDFAVAITFDDGLLSQFENALPELQIRNWPASFFITTKYDGQKFMQQHHLQTLVLSGFHVGSHSVSHTRFSMMNEREIFHEVQTSFEYLETNIGIFERMLSLPYGSYNRKSIAQLQQLNLDAILTTDGIVNKNLSATSMLHRCNMKSATSLKHLLDNSYLHQSKMNLKQQLRKFIVWLGAENLFHSRDEKRHQQLEKRVTSNAL